MLKRNVAILLAGGLLGVQAGLAGAQGTFPPSTDDTLYELLPAQAKYWAQREATNPKLTGAPGRSAIPAQTAIGAAGVLSPRNDPRSPLVKYLNEREASLKAASAGEKTMKINAATKYINVVHESTVRIENDRGQNFVWTANTLGEADLPLQAIAPKNFASGQTRVFVRHPVDHVLSD